ncbi:MAG: CDGSH iron-sulfur domain-containing protein [Acidobacteriota bacterium]
MADPEIAKKGPYIQETPPGEYWWCSCGRSKQQPFCDGAHKGTDFKPIRVTVEAQERLFWCGCKHSAKKPFCDGKHREL